MQIELNALITLCRGLRTTLLDYYNAPNLTVEHKADQSPITAADAYCHHRISEFLNDQYPDLLLVSEESEPPILPPVTAEPYWCLDPLDGTKEFIHHTGEFTINLALIKDHKPIFGLIYVPIEDTCYYASVNQAAYKQVADHPAQTISVAQDTNQTLRLIASRRHGNEVMAPYLKRFKNVDLIHKGSAWKLCLIAEGRADLYPRFAPTSAWDIAAGQCIVEAAGGVVVDLNGEPLRYGQRDTWLNPKFVCCSASLVESLQEINILSGANSN